MACFGRPAKEKIVEKIVEKTVEVEKPEELIACVASHGVPDWDKWYEEYQKMTSGTDPTSNFHIPLGVKITFLGCSTDAEGKQRTHVIHVLPKKNKELCQKILDFNAPPFVGGPDFIKNGIVIPPCNAAYYEITDVNFAAMFRKEHMMGTFSHGIKEYKEWRAKYYGAQDMEIGGIDVKPMLVGSCDDGKKCFVVNAWPKADDDKMKAMMDFDSEENPVQEYIKAGDIILPMEKEFVEWKAIDRHIR